MEPRGGCTCTFWLQLTALVAGSDPGTYTMFISRYIFSIVFSGLCRLSHPETITLASGLGSFMLATLFVAPCICHYFHVLVVIVKCIKFRGFITIYWGSSAKTLSHTPKMLYGKVLNNIAWGSLPKICKTLHWKTPYLSTSGVVLHQLCVLLIKAIVSLHVLLWVEPPDGD